MEGSGRSAKHCHCSQDARDLPRQTGKGSELFEVATTLTDSIMIERIGHVGKPGFQEVANMIQDSFCGGCFGSIVDGRRRMGVL